MNQLNEKINKYKTKKDKFKAKFFDAVAQDKENKIIIANLEKKYD